jgi:hypothetical protein
MVNGELETPIFCELRRDDALNTLISQGDSEAASDALFGALPLPFAVTSQRDQYGKVDQCRKAKD